MDTEGCTDGKSTCGTRAGDPGPPRICRGTDEMLDHENPRLEGTSLMSKRKEESSSALHSTLLLPAKYITDGNLHWTETKIASVC